MRDQKIITLFLWGMLSALSFIACKVTEKNRPVQAPPGFDWQGHRGCRGLLPENSLPAFLKAAAIPELVTLELDLAVSKDQQLIVSHEPWFNPAICHLPNGDSIPGRDLEKYLIYQMSLAEIRNFDCGSWGNPRFPTQQAIKTYKPILREVVEAVRKQEPEKAKTIKWNIEIKSQPNWDGLMHPPVEEFARLTIAELRALGLEKNANVQSFDIRALQAMHRQAPDIRLAYLIENMLSFDVNMDSLGFKPDIYSPYYLLVTKKLVHECHSRGIQLIPWTVNDITAMRKLIRLGVDGIITDYPDRIGAVSK